MSMLMSVLALSLSLAAPAPPPVIVDDLQVVDTMEADRVHVVTPNGHLEVDGVAKIGNLVVSPGMEAVVRGELHAERVGGGGNIRVHGKARITRTEASVRTVDAGQVELVGAGMGGGLCEGNVVISARKVGLAVLVVGKENTILFQPDKNGVLPLLHARWATIAGTIVVPSGAKPGSHLIVRAEDRLTVDAKLRAESPAKLRAEGTELWLDVQEVKRPPNGPPPP